MGIELDEAIKDAGRVAMLETMRGEAEKKKRLDQLNQFERLKLQKEYNEKVMGLLHPNQRPSVVGIMSENDPRKAYEFVRFDKVETKHPIEYVDASMLDYTVKNIDKENS